MKTSKRIFKKLPRQFTPVVFAFYMATIMAFLMCCTIVAVGNGFSNDYWLNVLKAYMLAMPVAFCCVIIVRPIVIRLVQCTVDL